VRMVANRDKKRCNYNWGQVTPFPKMSTGINVRLTPGRLGGGGSNPLAPTNWIKGLAGSLELPKILNRHVVPDQDINPRPHPDADWALALEYYPDLGQIVDRLRAIFHAG
jgi:hypothetical protein